jgi:RND family efflux transporter MFP subunit
VREGRALPVVLALLLVALLIIGALPRLRQRRDRQQEGATMATVPTVFTERVTRDTGGTSLDLSGSIAGLREAGIYARTNGFVKSLRVDLGSSVRAGDTLLVLDMPDVAEQARQSRATLEQVEATAAFARATLARWRTMSERNAVTRQELDEKEAAASVADASVRAARANAANLAEILRFGALTAPFSGIVTQRNVDVGSLVSAGAVSGNRALLTITQADTLRMMLNVPQSAASQVRIGQIVKLSVQELGTTGFAGRVALTARAIDPASRTLLTEVHVINTDRRLLPGMFAHAMITLPSAGDGLRIPAIALIIRADGPQVARVENGTVHMTPIKLGRDFGTTLEVLDGIAVGAAVIVNPSEQLTEGTKVRAVARGEQP